MLTIDLILMQKENGIKDHKSDLAITLLCHLAILSLLDEDWLSCPLFLEHSVTLLKY